MMNQSIQPVQENLNYERLNMCVKEEVFRLYLP